MSLSFAAEWSEKSDDALNAHPVSRYVRNVETLRERYSVRLHNMPGEPGQAMVNVDSARAQN